MRKGDTLFLRLPRSPVVGIKSLTSHRISGVCAVRYDRRRNAIPRALIPVVAKAEPEIAAELELSPMGTTLRFPLFDADFGVRVLVRARRLLRRAASRCEKTSMLFFSYLERSCPKVLHMFTLRG